MHCGAKAPHRAARPNWRSQAGEQGRVAVAKCAAPAADEAASPFRVAEHHHRRVDAPVPARCHQRIVSLQPLGGMSTGPPHADTRPQPNHNPCPWHHLQSGLK